MEFGACGHILESLLDTMDTLAPAEVLLGETLLFPYREAHILPADLSLYPYFTDDTGQLTGPVAFSTSAKVVMPAMVFKIPSSCM